MQGCLVAACVLCPFVVQLAGQSNYLAGVTGAVPPRKQTAFPQLSGPFPTSAPQMAAGRDNLCPHDSSDPPAPIPARKWEQPSVACMTLTPRAAVGAAQQPPPAAALEVWGVALPRRLGDPAHVGLMMLVQQGCLKAIQSNAAAAASWAAVLNSQGMRGSRGAVAARKAALLVAVSVSKMVLL